MKRFRQVAGFILAGGASSRMGRDKALLEIGGVPLLARSAQLLEPLVGPVIVVGAPERYASLGLRVVADDRSGVGPLGGLATALRLCEAPWALVVGCDLPYLSADWLTWLLERALASPAEAVVPESSRGLEPLCAVYRAQCAPALAQAIARGVRKVTDALAEVFFERVAAIEWQGLDPRGTLLKNMNTPEDYEEAQARLGS